MNKIVLITGATSGIGLGCARKFAENGDKLILTGRINPQRVSLCAALFEDFVKAIGLYNAHAVYFLVLANLTTNLHPFCQQVDELTVYFVNLIAQSREGVGSERIH